MDYWYDEQLRRYLLQFMRIFGGFSVKEGLRDGVEYYNRIPVRYADMNRMVGHILKKGSENLVGSTPFMACSISSLLIARDRAADPLLVDKVQIAERQYDSTAQSYVNSTEENKFPGNLYTTDRYMPVPYNLTMNVDIWSGNTDQKLQILEQILILFNPSLVLQSSTNPLDWTSLFEVELTDIQWSNRSIPAGVDETIDIATLTFTLPIWLNPPAKVKRQKIINTIVTNITDTSNIQDLGYDEDIYDFFRTLDNQFQVHTISPNNYRVEVIGSEATLYKDNGTILANWNDLLEVLSPQGKTGTAGTEAVDLEDIPLTPGSSLQLNLSNDISSTDMFITGTVVRNTIDPTKLIFTLDSDTLPGDTLADLTRIVDPTNSYPGDGNLSAPAIGQRYLLTEEIQGSSWGISAVANDIIEFTGSEWQVVFSSDNEIDNVYYIKNNYTQKQFKWENSQWTSSHEGIYNPGYWILNV